MVGLNKISIEDNIPYHIIFTTLQTYCNDESIKKGDESYVSFINNPDNASYFNNKSIVRQKLRFISIRNLVARTNPKDSESFCSQKIFLYKVLEKVQDKQEAD